MHSNITDAVKGMSLKKEFTIGDLIQIIILLVGVAGAFFTLSSRISLLEQEMKHQKEMVNSRVNSIEQAANHQLLELDRKLEKYDAKIEQYEKLLRQTGRSK